MSAGRMQVRRLLGGSLALVAAALVTLALALPASAAAKGYQLAATWQVDGGGMTVAGANVYVLADGGVTKFTKTGKKVTAWSDQVGAANGITADPAGNIYVLAGGDTISGEPDHVTEFNPNGGFLDRGNVTIGGENLFTFDIDIDPKGDTYISHAGVGIFDEIPRGILRFSSSGQGLAAWGEQGVGNGQFGSGIYMTSDGRGNVYVADRENDRIEKFTDKGAYVTQWGQSGTGPGQFIYPNAVAVDKKGAVYVVDAISPRVQKFSPTGKLLETIAIPNDSEDSSPDAILDIEVDSQGNVIVLENEDTYGTRFGSVYVFKPDRKGPATKVTQAPAKTLRTSSGAAQVTVKFKSEPGARFQCRLDKAKFKTCKSPYSVSAGAKPGKGAKHTIQIRGLDAAGNFGKPAKVNFTVVRGG